MSAKSSTNEAKPLIVGIGELLWDCFPGVPPRLGGAPANVAFHAAQLGAEGIVVSRVGDDENGNRAAALLQSRRMTTAFVGRGMTHPTGTVEVALSLTGQPSYIIAENVAWDFLEWSDSLDALARRASAVCFGSLAQRTSASRETIRRFVAATPPAAIRLFDINLRQQFYTAELLRASLEAASALKLNEDELTVLTDLFALPLDREEAMLALQREFSLSLIALTEGARGATLLAAGQRSIFVPADPVPVVDTVGAGDAFTAALLVSLMQEGIPLEEIGRHANRVGGYVAGCSGAMPILPPDILK